MEDSFRDRLAGVIWVVVLCSCRPMSFQDSNPPEFHDTEKLQQAIDRAIGQNQTQQSLGISAAVIVPGYKTWTGVSGYSEPGVPITADMMFDAGSIAKNFEAALALKLAEKGLLDLDDPISKYLPAYPNVDGNITIRQLLNHTSGIFNVFEDPNFPWVGAGVDYSKSWKLEEVFDAFVQEPYGIPGYAQHYSSTNYLLLTSIIAEATGDSIPEAIRCYFLKPMNLKHTQVSMGDPLPSHFAVAHPWVDVDQDGVLDDLYGIALTWKVTLTHPALFSTSSDLATWIQALYQDRRVLEASSMTEMLAIPEVVVHDPDGGVYGLGVTFFTNRLGVPVWGHAGSSLGYSGAALYLPEAGISMAWLVNTGESPRDLADQIMFDAWSNLYNVLRGR